MIEIGIAAPFEGVTLAFDLLSGRNGNGAILGDDDPPSGYAKLPPIFYFAYDLNFCCYNLIEKVEVLAESGTK